VNLALFSQLPG